ncbi:MAG TPA: hypothetical protein VLS89_01770 [Candidatus Nanopelagicales bacterium]|nr:hypothetical protein [Candidatus Nanopelagicales bacterium]
MRAALNLLVVSSLVLAAGAAEAQPGGARRVLRAEITGVEVDPESHLAGVEGGAVVIDRRANEIQLELYPGEGAEPDEGIQINLPITSVQRNGCGSIIYTAERDLRPVDGPRERLEVSDNRFLICRILLPPTEIRYVNEPSGFGGPAPTTRAYFTAERLQQVVVRPERD